MSDTNGGGLRDQWVIATAGGLFATVVGGVIVFWLTTGQGLWLIGVHGSPPSPAATNTSQPSPPQGSPTPPPASAPIQEPPGSPGGLLADLSSAATGQSVDGIPCESAEQLQFHIHAHLAIFVDGHQRGIPPGVGIGDPVEEYDAGPFVTGDCYYWVHTHTPDGIIHVESARRPTFTLGDFFAIWGQPLNATQVGPAQGDIYAYVNGQPFEGDPSTIPISTHALIQLDVGSNVAPQPFFFPPGL